MYHARIREVARIARLPVQAYEDHFSVTPDVISELRECSYIERWRRSREKGWFHIELEDHSLFLFDEAGERASFSYLECPLDVPSFEEYLASLGVEHTKRNRREFAEDYQSVVETAGAREYVTPIRFDLDPVAYRAGVHPLAHLHVGLGNNVRIGLRKRMTRLSFLLFVMRQMYPACWERLINHQWVGRLPHAIRDECIEVPVAMWNTVDQLELHLF